jgi:hypothetical protein
MKTRQGVKNFTQEQATKIAGEDPDYMIRDMFEAIERKEYPSWDVFVQVMEPSEAENYRWNIFDMTKVWSHKDFPLKKIGKMTLNRNVCHPMSLKNINRLDHILAWKLFCRYRAGGILSVDYGTWLCRFS